MFKRTWIRKIALFICAFLLTAVFNIGLTNLTNTAFAENFLANGDFETQTAGSNTQWMNNIVNGWSTYSALGSPAFYGDDTTSYTGAKSVKVTAPIGTHRGIVFQNNIPVTVGNTYKISCYIKAEGATAIGGVRINYYNGTGGFLSSSQIFGSVTGTTTGWIYVEGIVAIPTNTAKVTIDLIFNNGTGTIWFDNVQFGPYSVPVTGISLDKTSDTLAVIGPPTATTLTASVLPFNASNKAVTWSTSNAGIATVDATGVVTAVAPGTATITAATQDGGFTAACTVTVLQQAVHPTGFALDRSSISLFTNDIFTLNTIFTPLDTTLKTATWTSSNTAVATVNNGTITALNEGSTTITATSVDGGLTATCNVTVLSNLVANGGFEIVTNGNANSWATYISTGTPMFSISPSICHNGANSFQISAVSSSRAYVYQDKIPVTGGSGYNLSAWVKTDNYVTSEDGASLLLYFYDSNGKLVSTSSKYGKLKLTNDWTLIQDVLGAPLGSVTVKVELRYELGTGTVYFDDVRLNSEIVAATGISLDKTSDTIAVNGPPTATTLNASVLPFYASNKTVTWSTSNAGIATVDATGVVTAVAPGTATITAATQDGGFTAACTVTVLQQPVHPTGFALDRSSISLFTNDIYTLNTIFTPLDTTLKTATWTSSNTAVATVNNGTITALNEGSTTISAISVDGGLTATCNVTVLSNMVANGGFELVTNGNANSWASYISTGAPTFSILPSIYHNGANSIQISAVSSSRAYVYQDKIPVTSGSGYKLSLWGKTDNYVTSADGASLMLYFYDAAGNILTVDSRFSSKFGKLKLTNDWSLIEDVVKAPVGATTMKVEMRYELGTGTVWFDDIRVIPWTVIDNVTLDKYKEYVETGMNVTLTAALNPSNTLDNTVVWTSSNEMIATVANGVVTGVSTGSAIITATVPNGHVSATCQIVVVQQLIRLTGFTLAETQKTITPGIIYTLNPIYTPSDATIKDLTWVSSDPNVVSVNNGVISGLATGSAIITATAMDGGFTATCTINVVASDIITSNYVWTINLGNSFTETVSAVDINGHTLHYAKFTDPINGTLTVNGNGQFNYKPRQYYFTGTDSFQISALDDFGNGNIINVFININNIKSVMDSLTTKHPRILIDSAQLTQLRNEIMPGGVREKFWITLKAEADKIAVTTPPAYIYPCLDSNGNVIMDADYDTKNNISPNNPYYDPAMGWQRFVGHNTTTLLVAYVLSGDPKYFDATKQWMLASVSYPYWEKLGSLTNSDLAAGHQLLSLGLVYDWLYNELDVQTRDTIRNKILQVGTTMYNNYNNPSFAFYQQWLQNHYWVAMNGLSAAAAAIYDEEGTTVLPWMELALYKFSMSMEYLGSDGASHEGYSYWEYGLEYLLMYAEMAKSLYGMDMFKGSSWLQNTADYGTYMQLPRSNWTASESHVDIGDSPRYSWYGPSYLLRVLAAEYKDGHAQWLAEQIENSTVDKNVSQWMSVLWYDPSVIPAPITDTPTMHYFDDMGIVSSRSDWSGNESMVVLKSGPFIGRNAVLANNTVPPADWGAAHVHPDANNFIMYANGEFLIKDDGYAYKFTGNHNTLLVNQIGQMGEGGVWFNPSEQQKVKALPSILKAESSTQYDYIVGDATQAYSAIDTGLKKYQRHLVYLKQLNVVLVLDDIEVDQAKPLELRFFPESKAIASQMNGTAFYVTGKKTNMRFLPFTLQDVTVSAGGVAVHDRDNNIIQELAFSMKTSTQSKWRNAVAITWSDKIATPPVVKYKEENGIYKFEVNGQIAALDPNTMVVQMSTGSLGPVTGEGANDASLSSIFLNGTPLSGFSPVQYSYDVQKDWKTWDLAISSITSNIYATTNVIWDGKVPGTAYIDVTSADGSVTQRYQLNFIATKLLSVKQITTSSSSADPYLTIDNDPATLWSAQNNPCITYDLGNVMYTGNVSVMWNRGDLRKTYFEVLLSSDGVNWTSVFNGESSGMTADYENYDFPDMKARYVKIIGHGNSEAGRDNPLAYTAIKETSIFSGDDIIAPTWTNGSLTSFDPIMGNLTLSWGGASDNVDIESYRIFKDGVLLNTVAGTVNTYNVSGLVQNQTYTFKVEAGDAAGSWSTNGPSLTLVYQTP